MGCALARVRAHVLLQHSTGDIHQEAVLSAVLVLQQGDAMTIVNSVANDDIYGLSTSYHTHFEGHLINRT